MEVFILEDFSQQTSESCESVVCCVCTPVMESQKGECVKRDRLSNFGSFKRVLALPHSKSRHSALWS
jgi:hypothetical protein